MENLSSIVVFWICFGSFMIPVFLIALMCSIAKVIRDRKHFKQRQSPDENVKGQRDSATSDTTKKHILQLKFIEDEERKRQYNNMRQPSSTKGPTKVFHVDKDSAVDKVNVTTDDRTKNVRINAPSSGKSKNNNNEYRAVEEIVIQNIRSKKNPYKRRISLDQPRTSVSDTEISNGSINCAQNHTKKRMSVSAADYRHEVTLKELMNSSYTRNNRQWNSRDNYSLDINTIQCLKSSHLQQNFCLKSLSKEDSSDGVILPRSQLTAALNLGTQTDHHSDNKIKTTTM